MKSLKNFVRNLAHPEGSTAQGYQVKEALGFITEYITEYDATTRRFWNSEEDLTMVDEILQDKRKPR